MNTRNGAPKRESPVRLPFRKGRRSQRIRSFRRPGGSGVQLASSDVVPVAGLEPARDCSQGILSPRCLPFHHTGVWVYCTTRCGVRQDCRVAYSCSFHKNAFGPFCETRRFAACCALACGVTRTLAVCKVLSVQGSFSREYFVHSKKKAAKDLSFEVSKERSFAQDDRLF